MNNRQLNKYEKILLEQLFSATKNQRTLTKQNLLHALLVSYQSGFFRSRSHAQFANKLLDKVATLISHLDINKFEQTIHNNQVNDDLIDDNEEDEEIEQNTNLKGILTIYPDAMLSVYRLMNEYKPETPINSTGDLIEALQVYFNFFPEDLIYITSSTFKNLILLDKDYNNRILSIYLQSSLFPTSMLFEDVPISSTLRSCLYKDIIKQYNKMLESSQLNCIALYDTNYPTTVLSKLCTIDNTNDAGFHTFQEKLIDIYNRLLAIAEHDNIELIPLLSATLNVKLNLEQINKILAPESLESLNCDAVDDFALGLIADFKANPKSAHFKLAILSPYVSTKVADLVTTALLTNFPHTSLKNSKTKWPIFWDFLIEKYLPQTSSKFKTDFIRFLAPEGKRIQDLEHKHAFNTILKSLSSDELLSIFDTHAFLILDIRCKPDDQQSVGLQEYLKHCESFTQLTSNFEFAEAILPANVIEFLTFLSDEVRIEKINHWRRIIADAISSQEFENYKHLLLIPLYLAKFAQSNAVFDLLLQDTNNFIRNLPNDELIKYFVLVAAITKDQRIVSTIFTLLKNTNPIDIPNVIQPVSRIAFLFNEEQMLNLIDLRIKTIAHDYVDDTYHNTYNDHVNNLMKISSPHFLFQELSEVKALNQENQSLSQQLNNQKNDKSNLSRALTSLHQHSKNTNTRFLQPGNIFLWLKLYSFAMKSYSDDPKSESIQSIRKAYILSSLSAAYNPLISYADNIKALFTLFIDIKSLQNAKCKFIFSAINNEFNIGVRFKFPLIDILIGVFRNLPSFEKYEFIHSIFTKIKPDSFTSQDWSRIFSHIACELNATERWILTRELLISSIDSELKTKLLSTIQYIEDTKIQLAEIDELRSLPLDVLDIITRYTSNRS